METVNYTETSTYKNINLAIRVLLAILFLFSAVSKLYGMSPSGAIATFEQQQLITGLGFTKATAVHFSRMLIGIEFGIGFLLLQNHYFKRFILPVSFLMLLVFCIHLSYVIITVGDKGSCGCFGELLPMKPSGALIKNLIAMVAMGFLYRRVRLAQDKLNFFIPLSVVLACCLIMYMIAPVAKESSIQQFTPVMMGTGETQSSTSPEPTATTTSTDVKSSAVTDPKQVADPAKAGQEVKPEAPAEPKPKKSGYAQFFPDIDKGKKILCFFAPGCDHCQNAAKQLTELKKADPSFPEIGIIFMDEETELIPEFFNIAGAKYPHLVLDVGKFWQTLGGDRNTPGVFYLWNGNVIKVFDGTEANAFKKSELKTIVEKPWKGK